VKRCSRILLLGAILLGFAVCVGMPRPVAATDWQGHRLPNTPTNFIFGYGSLINSASRNSSVTVPIPAIPVRVSAAFGYVRTWNDRSVSGFTALGLRKLNLGETGRTINGVLYPAEGADMSSFDAREKGYVRVEVPLSQIEAVGWQRLPETGHVWTYIPVLSAEQGGKGVPGQGLPEPDAMFPLLQSYIDVVVEGGLEYGPDFAREILETTDGWSQFWLNDRELARRPWVHDSRSDAVDVLLTGTPASAADFSARAFPEMYGAKLRAGSAQ
jgi:hypothetical protein